MDLSTMMHTQESDQTLTPVSAIGGQDVPRDAYRNTGPRHQRKCQKIPPIGRYGIADNCNDGK